MKKKSLVGWMYSADEKSSLCGYTNLKFKSVRIPPDKRPKDFGIRFPILWRSKVDGFDKVRITIEEIQELPRTK